MAKLVRVGRMVGCIRIERERDGFSVCLDDPELVAKNDEARGKDGFSWTDPTVDYDFETKEQVLAFLDKALDLALPKDDYSSTFDKLAKEAMKS